MSSTSDWNVPPGQGEVPMSFTPVPSGPAWYLYAAREMAKHPRRTAGALVQSLYNNFIEPTKIVSDVWSGRVDPRSDEGLAGATNLALAYGLGSVPVERPGGSVGVGGRQKLTDPLAAANMGDYERAFPPRTEHVDTALPGEPPSEFPIYVNPTPEQVGKLGRAAYLKAPSGETYVWEHGNASHAEIASYLDLGDDALRSAGVIGEPDRALADGRAAIRLGNDVYTGLTHQDAIDAAIRARGPGAAAEIDAADPYQMFGSMKDGHFDNNLPWWAEAGSGTRSAVPNSDNLAPPGLQDLVSGDQVSTRPVPSGSSTTLPMTPLPKRDGGVTTLTMDPSSNRYILQGSNDYQSLMADASAMAPAFQSEMEHIAGKVPGASVFGVRTKDLDGIMGKLNSGRPASTISDYLGGRLIASSREGVLSLMNELRRYYPALHEDNFIDNPRNGYRAAHVQVNLGNGMSAEVQIVPKPVAEVQEQAHKVYDKFKRLDPESLSPEDLARYKADSARVDEMFRNAWQKGGWDAGRKP